MEAMVNQWNEAENEVEEMGLQRKRGHKRSSSSSSSSSNSSNKDVEVKAVDYVNEFSVLKDEGLEFDESENKEEFDMIRAEVNAEMILQHEDTENGTILPASDPPLTEDSTSLNNVTSEIGIVGTINENDKERQELYLERVFQKPPTHGFYCPNCKSCIQKVYIQKGELEQINAPTQPVQTAEQIRCSSCFSFLIPIGSWLFPGLVSEDGEINYQVTGSSQPKDTKQKFKVASQYEATEFDQSEEQMNQSAKDISKSAIKITDDKGKQSLQTSEEVVLHGLGSQKIATEVEDKINDTGLESISRNIPGNNKKYEDSSSHVSATPQDQGKDPIAPKKKHFWSNWAVIGDASEAPIPKQPKIGFSKQSDWRVITAAPQATIPKQPEIDFPDEKQQEHIEVTIDEVYTAEVVSAVSTPLLTRREPTVPASSKPWEILKSIVYGGLVESLTSLSVVTSAASADATTLNIVALAIANLIGGLFVLGHNLKELKSEQPKRAENDADAPVDQYNELLGHRENFILHAFIAILSFIVFGLLPPVVYGFSFRESDDKDFKLAAVAAASLLCITLLSIAKAYIKRPSTYLTYFKTVLYYVTISAVASVLSYLAGDLVKKLIEKLGWFESASNFSMQIPGISVQQPLQPTWGSLIRLIGVEVIN